MRKIEYTLETGYCGCDDAGEMEIDEYMSNDEIDAMVQDMALEWATTWEGDNRLGWHEDMSEEEQEDETTRFYENVEGSWKFIT